VKLGLFLALFHDRSLGEALAAARAAGCEAVEISTTGPHGGEDVAAAAAAEGLEISALSCHANPLHPNRDIAEQADRDFRDTVRRAAEAGIANVITFSGCPGESETSQRPSWVTCSWPDDYPETLDWQWNERVLPYWAEAGEFAREQGVRVAIEPQPGFVVYNTASMLRLREAAGPPVGVNFDPSHFFWQQIDPLAAARALGGAIFHVHAKDTGFEAERLAVDGVLETRLDPAERTWIFRTVGEGHDADWWRSLAGALREAGYDGALSIEHEDPLLPQDEGLVRAVETLRAALS
jgi:sugar phosphate isomerase/epimerase